MQDLCTKLGIKDIGLMKKIWTCFEYCIVHHIELMQDRHLDQILMCSIYVICKVAHTDVSTHHYIFEEFFYYYLRFMINFQISCSLNRQKDHSWK